MPNILSKVIILLSLLYLSTTIQKSCSLQADCPQNSVCNIRLNTCKCLDGFIGQCDIAAVSLTDSPSYAIELKQSNISYFSISPLQSKQFMDIRINICQYGPLAPITAYFWGETGYQSKYDSTTTFFAPIQLSFEKNCSVLTLSSIYFYTQKNGESQKLILGLQSQNEDNVALLISVEQKRTFDFYISHYLTIGFLIVLLISFCGCMLINIRRRSRFFFPPQIVTQTEHSQQEYNIDYFETYLPKTKVETNFDVSITCPICLQNFEKDEIIRKTPCQHTFHSECLDSWCKKNVNCPFCRSDLSYQYVKALKDSLNIEPTNKDKKYIKNWEQEIELQDRFTGDNSSIRQQML